MHALFLLEDRFGIEPCVDGSIRFTNEAIQSCVCTWRSWKEFLEEGKITREEYEDKKDGLVGERTNRMGKRKTIVCLETGKQFNSVENAANAIGVSSGFISRQIKAGKQLKVFTITMLARCCRMSTVKR